MSPNNTKRIQMFYLLLAGGIAIGSLTFSVGRATAPTTCSLDIEDRVEKCEKLLERWDERWTFIKATLSSIEDKIDRNNKGN